MLRLSGLILFASFISSAMAQETTAPAPAPSAAAASGERPSPGNYSGRIQEAEGKRTAQIKMNIRDITQDGRITATVQSTHRLKSCAKRLPASGIVLPEGGMRLEVNAGAPDRCERVYNLNVAGANTVSGTFIDADKTLDRKPKR
jgi:hypothetical protein